jgi:hypothetical protein
MPRAKDPSRPPESPAPATHFVVERLNWRRRRRDVYHRYPGQTRVASFDTPDQAEAYRREQEAKARAVVNPFAGCLAPPTEQTSLPEEVFCDWLTDHGVEPPRPAGQDQRRDWAAWWKERSPEWDERRRAAVWERLDRVTFFRVSERPKLPVVYAVVKAVWGYNDEWYYPGSEGGEVQTVYRSRQKAEEVAARENESAREEWRMAFEEFDMGYAPAGLNQFDLEGRLMPGWSPFEPTPTPTWTGGEDREGYNTFPPEEVAFFEVVEVELEGGQ